MHKADESDCETYAEILSKSWIKTYKGIIPQDDLERLSCKKHKEAAFKKSLLMNHNIYIAKLDKTPIGVVNFYPHDKDAQSAYICQLYLSPEYIKKGYGSIILKHTEDKIRKSGFKRIKLNCLDKNTGAKKFYEKHGYLFTGTEDSPLFTQKVVRALYQKEL